MTHNLPPKEIEGSKELRLPDSEEHSTEYFPDGGINAWAVAFGGCVTASTKYRMRS